MKTGIFYRICRDGKWQSIDLSDMTLNEIKYIFTHHPIVACRVIKKLCEIMSELEVEE